jgi:hypothetical protein
MYICNFIVMMKHTLCYKRYVTFYKINIIFVNVVQSFVVTQIVYVANKFTKMDGNIYEFKIK